MIGKNETNDPTKAQVIDYKAGEDKITLWKQQTQEDFVGNVVVEKVNESYEVYVNGELAVMVTGDAITKDDIARKTYTSKADLANNTTFTPSTTETEGTEKDDELTGGVGIDVIDGKTRNDLINGDKGDDTLLGGKGDDTFFGGEGNDVIKLGDGNDRSSAGGIGSLTHDEDLGDDTIYGGAGNDDITDASGKNMLDGGDGNDKLNAIDDRTGQADTVMGGKGSDILMGDDGDTLTDGEGNDEFEIYHEKDDAAVVIEDFDPTNEIIELVATKADGTPYTSDDVTIETDKDAKVTTIFVDGQEAIKLKGVTSFSIDKIVFG